MKPDVRRLVATSVAITVIILCGAPIVGLIATAANGAWTVERRDAILLLGSLGFATAVAGLSMSLGGVSAGLMHSLPRPVASWAMPMFCVPLFIPTYVHVLGWNGLFSAWGWPQSETGRWLSAVWVLGTAYAPLPMLGASFALQRWKPLHSWSAWTSGKARLATGWLMWAYLRTVLFAMGLLVLVLAFSDFAVPDYFQISTYSTEVFVAVSSYLDIPAAVRLSLPAVVVCMALLWLLATYFRRIGGSDEYRDAGPAKAWSGNAGGLALVLALWAVLTVLLPLFSLAAATKGLSGMLSALPMVRADAVAGALLAAAVTVAVTGLALFCSYGWARHEGMPPTRMLSFLMLVMPASLLGVATVGLWNRPETGWVYDSGMALGLAVGARWFPVSAEILHLGWRQVDRTQEWAGWASGASWFSVFSRICVPQLMRPVVAALLLTFVLVFNELTLISLLAPPGFSTLPLRIFQTIHYGPESLLAALCVWQVLSLLLPLVLLRGVVRRWWAAGTASPC